MQYHDVSCLAVTLVCDAFYFAVNETCRRLTVGFGVAEVSAEKDLVLRAAAVDRSHFSAHAVGFNHRPCERGRLLDILSRPRGRLAENQFLGDTAAECHFDLSEHMRPGLEQLLPVRKREGVACRADAGRDD